MSLPQAADAIAKLQTLSESHANTVLSLIEDLAELEALEDAEDLKDAREALAEMNRLEKQPAPANVEFSKTEFASDEAFAGGSRTVPYEKLRRELGLDR